VCEHFTKECTVVYYFNYYIGDCVSLKNDSGIGYLTAGWRFVVIIVNRDVLKNSIHAGTYLDLCN